MTHSTPTKKDIAQNDYLENMFQDGDNRTASARKIKNAEAYDLAAHTGGDESPNAEIVISAPVVDTFHGRDGTDAAGLYDESGGPVGCTEKELDDLEAGGTPVDRTPHMKD